jgi:hypothetical protein
MFAHPPLSAMLVEYLTPALEARAVEVQLLLAGRSQHRAPSIPDVLIPATAELTVLHLDKELRAHRWHHRTAHRATAGMRMRQGNAASCVTAPRAGRESKGCWLVLAADRLGMISLDIGGGLMADVLVRDVPEEVLAGVDAHAARLGLSRVEYIRRRLAADAATSGEAVSVADLRSFAEAAEDLTDPQVMGAAWQ